MGSILIDEEDSVRRGFRVVFERLVSVFFLDGFGF